MARFKVLNSCCLDFMSKMEENQIDSIVTDPPYGLKFMGKDWDHGVPGVHFWQEALRVVKPGSHILAFGGTRTYHRLACAIEDAGWELRDGIGLPHESGDWGDCPWLMAWVHGSGFPKSLDVSNALLKSSNETASKRWEGWGTALKPAWEPIVMARKPIIGTVAENVLRYGTGAINIDGGRVEAEDGTMTARKRCVVGDTSAPFGKGAMMGGNGSPLGRFPANIIHDGSDGVLAIFPETKSGAMKHEVPAYDGKSNTSFIRGRSGPSNQHGDSGSAARFFYCAKASTKERNLGLSKGERNTHPTVKPVGLLKYLCRLVTPPGGIVLDPFCGSGSTGVAALKEGFSFIGIDKEDQYIQIAVQRISAVLKEAPNNGQ